MAHEFVALVVKLYETEIVFIHTAKPPKKRPRARTKEGKTQKNETDGSAFCSLLW